MTTLFPEMFPITVCCCQEGFELGPDEWQTCFKVKLDLSGKNLMNYAQ